MYTDSKLSFCEHVERLLLSVQSQRLYLLSQLRKQNLPDKCVGIVYDAIVLSKVLYALSAWGGYISQSLKDRIDACFRKAYRWRLTSTQYKFDNLLFSMDSKLFAGRLHCLHHMLSPGQSSSQMILRSRGHSFVVPRVTYKTTKRSFLMRCLCREKSVLLGLGCPADV